MQETNPSELLDQLTQLAKQEATNTEMGSLPALANILSIAFSDLNHLEISRADSLAEPFAITVTENGEQKFLKREFIKPENAYGSAKFEERGTIIEQVFSIQVQVSKNFNVVTDLPKLTAELQKLHNEQMKKYDKTDAMVFLNTAKQLARYWKFFGAKLEKFVTEKKEKISEIDPENTATSKLEEYAQLCNLIGQGFSSAQEDDDHSEIAQEVDTSAVLNNEWKKTERRLNAFLERLGKRLKDENKGSDYVKKVIERAISFIGLTAQKNIIRELNTQSRTAFFEHCQAELFRKVGLGNLLSRVQKKKKSR